MRESVDPSPQEPLSPSLEGSVRCGDKVKQGGVSSSLWGLRLARLYDPRLDAAGAAAESRPGPDPTRVGLGSLGPQGDGGAGWWDGDD